MNKDGASTGIEAPTISFNQEHREIRRHRYRSRGSLVVVVDAEEQVVLRSDAVREDRAGYAKLREAWANPSTTC